MRTRAPKEKSAKSLFGFGIYSLDRRKIEKALHNNSKLNNLETKERKKN